ncbi:VraH family protein [Staphylococcus aureus]|uniref:VraH family peptide resistance protein n=1 Tax=Staphylococcus aureus TaxID=1280 RepID=UPI0018E9BE92|nr:VraH family protein [Staphylococcus aureus]MBJ6129053.1 VraH family protein [Staphylococcus aureus]MBJ6140335.1 VraH family protein [Staphylococcus aureus]MBJ6153989.1 VraH family protein [Staphylococcus aureus]MBJ6156581.1 VraH family protein [Staphylococcus aureus]MBJ6159282.1 VraH family protein [Staphylococcus aureus]
MSIKEIWRYLLNKKWKADDVCFLVLYIFLASIFTIPLLGVPIGVLAYLYFNEEMFK